MGLLDMFGKKAPSVPVVDQIIDMRMRGMPDPIILQNLQNQRVPEPEMQDAMMQADIKMRVGAGGPPSPSVSAPPQFLPQSNMPPQPGGMEYQGAQMAGMMAQAPMGQPPSGPLQMGPPPGFQMPPQMGSGGPPQIPPELLAPQMTGSPPQQFGPSPPQMMMGPPPQPPMGGPQMGSPGAYPSPMPQFGVSTEELVEKIVSEKIDRLEKRLVEQEKIHTDLLQQIGQVRSSVNDLKGKYSQLQEDSVVKIEEYNKELEGVGTQIKAMQRVMQNIIPTFAENVRSLTEVVKELKGGNDEVQQQPPRQFQRPPQQAMPVQQQSQPVRQPQQQVRQRVVMQSVPEEETSGGEQPWQARVRKIGKMPRPAEQQAGDDGFGLI